jgi:hypothetical protein
MHSAEDVLAAVRANTFAGVPPGLKRSSDGASASKAARIAKLTLEEFFSDDESD